MTDQPKSIVLNLDKFGLVPVWLLWAMYESGIIGLRGIATNNNLAQQWRKTLLEDAGVVRVWIDPTQLDHLYASNLTELIRK